MLRALPLLLLTLLCTCDRAPRGERPDPRPNVLFLFTDDHARFGVGALGDGLVRTPHLDSLIAAGTLFTHAYNMGAWQPAVCLASRAMLNTGRSVWRAAELDRRTWAGDTTAMADNWAPLLRRAGYGTYFSGKWHVAAPASAQFEVTRHVRPGMPNDNYPFPAMRALFARHAPGRPPLDSVRALFPPGYDRPRSEDDASWSPTDVRYGGFWAGGRHWTEVVADDGVDFLTAAAADDRPFFMYLAFNAPHDPRQAPRRYQEMYPPAELPVPASFRARYPYEEAIGLGPGMRDEDLAPYPRTELAVRTHTSEYYAAISHLDDQVGRILDALHATGQAENTVVIFTADHGLAVGRHGLFGKQNLYDHSVRVPLSLTGPGFAAGRTVGADVYLQDVMPTTLELAGAPVPDSVEFRSLLPVAAGSAPGLSAVYLAYTDRQRGVRRGNFKYLWYPDVPTERLYDLAADPEETNDLAADPAYAERLRELRETFNELERTYGGGLPFEELTTPRARADQQMGY